MFQTLLTFLWHFFIEKKANNFFSSFFVSSFSLSSEEKQTMDKASE